MKNSFTFLFVVLIFPLLVGCNGTATENNSVRDAEAIANPENTPSDEEIVTAQPITTDFPETATLMELVQGDIMCYATLVDEAGTEYNVGATFEICDQEAELLNQKVRLVYSVENVNDCESNEPCGKTREENLITDATIL